MRRSLPDLPEQEFLWRVHFMIGAMAHTMCGPPVYARSTAEPLDFQTRITRLVAFLTGGFHAPASQPENIEVNQ
jgi:hypothetical protein